MCFRMLVLVFIEFFDVCACDNNRDRRPMQFLPWNLREWPAVEHNVGIDEDRGHD